MFHVLSCHELGDSDLISPSQDVILSRWECRGSPQLGNQRAVVKSGLGLGDGLSKTQIFMYRDGGHPSYSLCRLISS